MESQGKPSRLCNSDVKGLMKRPVVLQMLFLLLLFNVIHGSDSFAFLKSSPASTSSAISSSRLHCSNTTVAFLLPSNPEEDYVLQESADQIVSKLKNNIACGSACAAACNTDEADEACQNADALIALGVESPFDVRFVATAFRLRRSMSMTGRKTGTCQFALGGKPFAPLLGEYDEANPTWQQDIPWSGAARDKKVLMEMRALFDKGEIEDYVQAIELFLEAKGGA